MYVCVEYVQFNLLSKYIEGHTKSVLLYGLFIISDGVLGGHKSGDK